MSITRDIGVERLYFIANYQNIKFDSKLHNIPEELANNSEVMDRLYYIQMLSCDIAYKNYMALRDRMEKEKVKSILELLKDERELAQKELNEKFGVTLEAQMAVEEQETK